MSDIAKMIAIAKRFGGGGGGEVVILPETELTLTSVSGDIGIYHLYMPIENTPAAGAKCKLIWGGMEYTNTVVDVSAIMGAPMLLLGNSGLFEAEGMGLENPDADAPYCVALVPDGMPLGEGDRVAYGMIMSMGITPDPPVLSIVQVGAVSGGESAGGGVFTVHATASYENNTFTFNGFDKSFSEMKAAYNADKHIRVVIDTGDGLNHIGQVMMALCGDRAAALGDFALCVEVMSNPKIFDYFYFFDAGNGAIAVFEAA